MTSPIANKKYFLLDTCIAEYWLDPFMQQVIADQLILWAGDTFDLAISEISYAEMIDGAYKARIERVKKSLNTYTQIEVSQRVLTGSAILSNVYKTKLRKTNGAGLQDKIIAATAFIYNLPIITADVLDFPHPFFTSMASETLAYSKKVRTHKHYITIDMLKPNTKELNYWYSQVK
jgi:predicted nucleic acid-binding protein